MLLNYSLWCLWEYLGVACNKPKLWTRELDQFYLQQQQDVKKHKEKSGFELGFDYLGSICQFVPLDYFWGDIFHFWGSLKHRENFKLN